MITTVFFTVCFPILASAMTGYNNIVADFVTDPAGNYIKRKDFQRVLFVIHDGWRINKTADYLVIEDKFCKHLRHSRYRDRALIL